MVEFNFCLLLLSLSDDGQLPAAASQNMYWFLRELCVCAGGDVQNYRNLLYLSKFSE